MSQNVWRAAPICACRSLPIPPLHADVRVFLLRRADAAAGFQVVLIQLQMPPLSDLQDEAGFCNYVSCCYPSLDAGGRLHDTHDAGARNAEGARQGADRFAGLVLPSHRRALLIGRAGWAAQGLALCLCPGQA
jgi:hypothetical protein